jgi:hypothetical protein
VQKHVHLVATGESIYKYFLAKNVIGLFIFFIRKPVCVMLTGMSDIVANQGSTVV